MNINDTFNRADGVLVVSSDGSWSWSAGNIETANGSSANAVQVVSNQCKQNNAASLVSVRAEVDLTNDDNYAQISVVVRGDTQGTGVYCRAATGTNPAYYLAWIDASTDNVQLYKTTGGGTFTQLGSNASVTVSLPQTLRIEAIGTAIKVYWDGVQKISVTDSSVTTGKRAGMRFGAPGSTLRIVDNFRAGDAPEVAGVARGFGLVIG